MKPKILYLDDEPHCLVSFKASFREFFRIYTAESAQDGLNILKKNSQSENIEENIQVVISDQRMPNVKGADFFESIRNSHPFPIRILLTGYSDITDLVQAVNKGKIYSYHTKPIKEDFLLKDIKEACKVYQLKVQKKQLSEDMERVNKQLEFMIRQKLLS